MVHGLLLLGVTSSLYAQPVWIWRNPMPTGNTLLDVKWTGTQLIAVGYAGAILTSTDGITWAAKNSNTSGHLNSVIWTGKMYVAIGRGTIVSSPDGITWTERSTLEMKFEALNSVAWTGEKFVLVGPIGKVYISEDGSDWKSHPIDGMGAMNSVTWSGTKLVAVGTYGEIRTSVDGSEWKKETSPDNENLSTVGWFESRFIAVGDDGIILTSPDAVAWTMQPTTFASNNLNTIIWTGKEFAVVGGENTKVLLTSPDGITWSRRLNFYSVNSLAWTGTQIVGVGREGTIRTAPTVPTVAWTERRATLLDDGLESVIHFNSLFAAVGSQAIITSPDGITWKKIGNWSASFRSAATSGKEAVAVGYRVLGKGVIVSTADGASWTERTTGTNKQLFGVAWTGAQFVAVGDSGAILTSLDGISWDMRTTDFVTPLSSVASSENKIVCVGNNGIVATSTDGITWKSKSVDPGNHLISLVWTGSGFVATGSKGALTSPDGETWAPNKNAPSTGNLSWTGKQIINIGWGKINASTDGAVWSTTVTSGMPGGIKSVFCTEKRCVAVGLEGSILTEHDVSDAIVPRLQSLRHGLLKKTRQGFSVHPPISMVGKPISATVYGIDGAVKYEIDNSRGEILIPNSALPPGKYFLMLKNGAETLGEGFLVLY
jgi:hypothetical protein